jgi:hypothetical protein
MLLAFAALGNSAAPGTSARAHVSYRRLRTVLFFGRLLEVYLNSYASEDNYEYCCGRDISELRFCIKHVCR